MPALRQVHECDEEDDADIVGIICPVWPGGCHHPELCKDKCFDDDLVRERGHIDNGTKE